MNKAKEVALNAVVNAFCGTMSRIDPEFKRLWQHVQDCEPEEANDAIDALDQHMKGKFKAWGVDKT